VLTAEIISAANLTPEHREQWLCFVAENAALDGPCFHPDFISGIARYVPECRVLLWRRGGTVIGYLPFKRCGRARGRTIPMCDYQAILGAPELARDFRDSLRIAGVRAWEFDNLIGTQVPLAQATSVRLTRSPRVEMREGFDAYVQGLKQAGKSGRNILNKLRLLERDHGSVTFQQGVGESALLRQMLDWKARRFTADGKFPAWVGETLHHFLAQRGGPVTGVLSVLKAGESVVAIHFGVRVGRLHYYWFPAYDEAFAKYTPGWLLVWFLLKHLPELGCDTLDFGPGGEAYKEYFANAHREFGTGLIETSESMARLHRGYARMNETLRQSALAQRWVKPAVHWLRGRARAATPEKT